MSEARSLPRRLLEKVAATMLGLLVALALLEAGLRLLGWAHHTPRPASTGIPGRSILCVGDSFTAGMGAPHDMSYPAQLSRLLEAQGLGSGAVNSGVLTQNSHQALQRLREDLPRYHPAIVVLMIGCSNRWNTEGLQSPSRQDTWRSRIPEVLADLRIWRLVSLVATNVQDREGPALPPPPPRAPGPERVPDWRRNLETLLQHREYEQVIQTTKHLRVPPDEEAERLFCLGLAYKDSFNYPAALPALQEAARLAPLDWRPQYHLGRIYTSQHKKAEAVACYKKATLVCPDPESTFTDLVGICSPAELAAITSALTAEKPALQAVLRPLVEVEERHHEIEAGIRRDLEESLRVCQQERARLVLMDYPGGLTIIGQKPSQLLRQVAEEHGLPFVDNLAVFSTLTDRASYFVPDGHCNAKGYGLIARNVLATVQPILSPGATASSPAASSQPGAVRR